MSRKFLLPAIISILFSGSVQGQHMLHLLRADGNCRLMVDGRPFIITGGELGNSTASSLTYLNRYWQRLEDMKLNTVIAPVYWELFEPEEGRFDYTQIDGLIQGARAHKLKLVLLWFGTWKNSMSCYVPGWMKTDQRRFPRTRNSAGVSAEIITPFSQNALAADKAAFVKLLTHLRQVDNVQHTVLMIQVENEIGMLPEARDHSAYADSAFKQPVPKELINYLVNHKNSLLPETLNKWAANGYKTNGSWSEVFGNDIYTDEWFTAWYFGRYVNEIAEAGKKIYPLPMYLNAALNGPGKKPGEYPAGGPLPHLYDVWKAAAPAIDMLSPDFYNPDFKHWSDLYTRSGNVLFIPEHRFEEGVAAKALYAIGHYHAIGFSPFAIEGRNVADDESLDKAYQIIHEMTPLITAAPADRVEGVLLGKEDDTVKLKLGDYLLTIAHAYTLPWAAKDKNVKWPLTGAIIIATAGNEFYVGGTGVVITFKPLVPGMQAGILKDEEGAIINGKWQSGRRLNGDEDHQGRHLRIDAGTYGLQRILLYNFN